MLPLSSKDHSIPISLLGIDITHCPRWVQFCSLSMVTFTCYIGCGYVQEWMFRRIEGMQPFGMYLTLLQFVVYSFYAYAQGKIHGETKRRIPLKTYVSIAFYTVATMGLSNASVGYLNYPTHLIFKCCKLIPVLIGGIIIQGKRYGCLDVLAASLMSAGLIVFTMADSQVAPNFDPRGYVMVCSALMADAVIGNVQEKALHKYDASNNEMVFYSYSIGCVYLFGGLSASGQLVEAFDFFSERPLMKYGCAFVFGTLGYIGVNVVLSLVRTFGALLAVTVTTVRKAVTITLSFLLFAKPFTVNYLWGGVIILLAIYINLYSKNRAVWHTLLRRCTVCITGLNRCTKPATLQVVQVL